MADSGTEMTFTLKSGRTKAAAPGHQQNRQEPDGKESENLRERNFFEVRHVAAGFFQQPLELLEQFVFVRREVGFRPMGGWGEQLPQFAAAAERRTRGIDRFLQVFVAVGRGVPEIFQHHDGVRQRVVADMLGFQRAGLDFEFGPPLQFADLDSIIRLRMAARALPMRPLRWSKSDWRRSFRASKRRSRHPRRRTVFPSA